MHYISQWTFQSALDASYNHSFYAQETIWRGGGGEGGTVKFELHVENELSLAKIKFTQ